MIPSFTAPGLDEAFYSLNARYFHQVGYYGIKNAYENIFGARDFKPCIDLPSHLNEFCNNTFHVLSYSPEDVIQKLTLFPFYRSFMVEKKRRLVAASIMSSNGQGIHTRVGINASTLKRPPYPRYCPLCALEDFERYNETYWRRSHQIPDLTICLTHGCLLAQYFPRINEINSRIFHYPFRDNLKLGEVSYPKYFIHSKVTSFFSHVLMSSDFFDVNNLTYEGKIGLAGLTRGKSIDDRALKSAFTKFYGRAELEEVLPTSLQSLSWLADFIRRPVRYFHPLRHALVSLFIDALEVRATSGTSPFGHGPWKCFNKASDHYSEKVVTHIETHIDTKSKRLVGVFTCTCGMVYSSSFIANRRGSVEEFIRIKKRGDLWMNHFKKLSRDKLSLREIARRLGTDAKTISMLKGQTASDFEMPSEIDLKSIKSKRKKWSQLLLKFKDYCVKNARANQPDLYAWLYRNDHEWLLATNHRSASKRSCPELKLDWARIDEDLLQKVEATIADLKSKNYKGRITKSLVAKIINYEKYIINKNSLKIPRTIQFLSRKTESLQDFQTRRIKRAVQGLGFEGEKIALWKVMRKAGLKKNLSEFVAAQVNVLRSA